MQCKCGQEMQTIARERTPEYDIPVFWCAECGRILLVSRNLGDKDAPGEKHWKEAKAVPRLIPGDLRVGGSFAGLIKQRIARIVRHEIEVVEVNGNLQPHKGWIEIKMGNGDVIRAEFLCDPTGMRRAEGKLTINGEEVKWEADNTANLIYDMACAYRAYV